MVSSFFLLYQLASSKNWTQFSGSSVDIFFCCNVNTFSKRWIFSSEKLICLVVYLLFFLLKTYHLFVRKNLFHLIEKLRCRQAFILKSIVLDCFPFDFCERFLLEFRKTTRHISKKLIIFRKIIFFSTNMSEK